MRSKLWLEAGRAAKSFELSIAQADDVVSCKLRQTMFDSYMRFVTLFDRGGGSLKPKHHAILHLVLETASRGNPRLYSTYRNESLNGILARVARSCHRSCWETRVHEKFSVLQQCGNLSWAEIH